MKKKQQQQITISSLNDYKHLYQWDSLGFDPKFNGRGSRHIKPIERKIHGTHIGHSGLTLWIFKNAHTWLKSITSDQVHYPKPGDKEISVLIRHPYDRWKSGVLQYASMNPGKEEFILDSIRDNHIIFDEHTLPQCCFIKFEAFRPGFLSWKEIEEWSIFRIPNHFQHWNNHWHVTDDLPPAVNVGIAHKAHLRLFTELDIAITRKTIKHIKEVYHDDYVLWELTEVEPLYTNNLL